MPWTEKQEQVIKERDKTILVSAAAGSGKTATLVERGSTGTVSGIGTHCKAEHVDPECGYHDDR